MENRSIRALMDSAGVAQRDGRAADAIEAYRAALSIDPNYVPALHNLGAMLAGAGDPKAALFCFEHAIAAEPHYALAHYNRAMALKAMGDLVEAAKSLAFACRIEPAFYDAHRELGFVWLALCERGRALDYFAHTYDLRRGDNRIGIARESLVTASCRKLTHDAAQFAHLSKGRGGMRAVQKRRTYEQVANEIPEGIVHLSDEQLDTLGEEYNTPIFVAAAPEVTGSAVTPRNDSAEIAAAFAQQGGFAIVDDLLTTPALATFRRFLLDTTLWHDFRHIDGFVASYLEDGLACPLFLQIADELRARFPELLGHLSLTQAWAFKALHARAAVAPHADDARISINFWVTPDEANRRPNGGGLAICTLPRVDHKPMRNYDQDRQDAETYLQSNAQQTVHIPYRQNRAVIFNSSLVHGSDAPDFEPGYENMRINVTMLFGHS